MAQGGSSSPMSSGSPVSRVRSCAAAVTAPKQQAGAIRARAFSRAGLDQLIDAYQRGLFAIRPGQDRPGPGQTLTAARWRGSGPGMS